MSFLLEDGKYGTRMIVTSAWSDSLFSEIEKNQVRELLLNHAKGWRGKDLSFLRKLRGLRVFEILDMTIKDVSPLNDLHELRSLDVITYCKTPIDFTQFPYLEEVALEWREGAKSIFACPTLKKYSSIDALFRLSNHSPIYHVLNILSWRVRGNWCGSVKSRWKR